MLAYISVLNVGMLETSCNFPYDENSESLISKRIVYHSRSFDFFSQYIHHTSSLYIPYSMQVCFCCALLFMKLGKVGHYKTTTKRKPFLGRTINHLKVVKHW